MRITAQTMAQTSYLTYKLGAGSNNFRSNALSSILGNLSASTNASAGNMFDLAAQFSSMKSNRSVLKSYYGNRISGVDSRSKIDSLTNKNNNSADKTEGSTASKAAAAKALESATEDLAKAAVNLSKTGRNKLFKADEEGNYDMDAIASAVKGFVDSYNETKKAVVDLGNNRAIQTAVSMVTSTAAVEKTLNKVGITINNDNTLSVNTDTLKSADIANIKALFSGVGSYAYGVSKQAAQINGYASADTGKYSGYLAKPTGSIIDMLA